MSRISSSELRPRLAEALRSAEGGDPVVITRHGRPAAALIAADQLARWSRPAGDEVGGTEAEAPRQQGDDTTQTASEQKAPERLLERAAAGSRRRIEHDLERLPETLKPVLVMIRENLFQPRLTVERIKRSLGVGANDLTTRFHAAAGAPIREYLENRRLECACRLLEDTELDVQTVALLVGHRGREVFARAFKRRYGVRPLVYREFGGRLSRDVPGATLSGRAPVVPRHLAGVAEVASRMPCASCGAALEPGVAVRVFEDLAPICDTCVRERAPELLALLKTEGHG